MSKQSLATWVADADAPNCAICDVAFSVTKRRHHCRECGHVCCHDCTKGRKVLQELHKHEKQRVCVRCMLNCPPPQNNSVPPLFRPARATVSHQGEVFDVETPYSCRNGIANIVFGTVDHAVAQKFVDDSCDPANPVVVTKTSDGKALAAIWLMEYFDTSCDPYREIVFSYMCGIPQINVPSTDRYAFLACWDKLPEGATLFLAKLWLNSNKAIAYGRDLFGTDKFIGDFDVEIVKRQTVEKYNVKDVLSASIKSPACYGGAVSGALRHAGFAGLMLPMTESYIDTAILCPNNICKTTPAHVAPLTISRLQTTVAATMHEWNEAKGDKLDIQDPFLLSFQFEPKITIRDPNIKFQMCTALNATLN